MSCPPPVTVLDGLTPDQLNAYLVQLQSALFKLTTGASEARVSIAQGDGTRDVTFRNTDVGQVTALILQVQQKLGLRRRARRPIRPQF